MSRIANKPVELPSGVDIKLDGQNITAKGSIGEMVMAVHPSVRVEQEDKTLTVHAISPADVPMAGTMRSLLNNLVMGVSKGFEKKLELELENYTFLAHGRKKAINLASYINIEGDIK